MNVLERKCPDHRRTLLRSYPANETNAILLRKEISVDRFTDGRVNEGRFSYKGACCSSLPYKRPPRRHVLDIYTGSLGFD
jgi:hypothetical protein